MSLNGPLCHLDLEVHLGKRGRWTPASSHPIKWDLGSPEAALQSVGFFGLAGGGKFHGVSRSTYRTAVGGMPQVRLGQCS